MNTLVNTQRRDKDTPLLHKMFFVIQIVTMLAVFLTPNYTIVCGPIMVFALTFLFFAGYHEFVFGVIITANDALGTMFMGKMSFQYLLLAFAVIKILQRSTISKKRLVFFLVMLYFLVQLLWVGTLTLKMFINAISYVLAVSSIMIDIDDETLARFFQAVSITVVVISIHAMITGGVEFRETINSSAIYDDEFLRRGILGVGTGNPNHSALLLNIGIIALWFFTSWSLMLKLLCMIPILWSFILTSSISALLALSLVLMFTLIIKKNQGSKKGKRFLVICIILLALILMFMVYSKLPDDMRFKELDGFIERIEEKIGFVEDKEWNSATTNRTNLAIKYLRYIFLQQGIFGLLFGGNSLFVTSVSGAISHNNYIGLLLQVGLVGTIVFLVASARRFANVWKNPNMPYRKGRLLLKVLCLFAAFGISLYGGSLWVFWMMILLLL